MADNCFQVWHCSVNEFVLFCRRLTVAFLPFISPFFADTHTASMLFDFSSLCLCFLVIWPPCLPSPWLSWCPLSFSSVFLFSPLFSQFGILRSGRLFYIFALLVVPFLCLVCSLSANNRGILYFAVRSSQQIVYLDFSCLVLLLSRLTVVIPPQQLIIPSKHKISWALSHCGHLSCAQKCLCLCRQVINMEIMTAIPITTYTVQ